MNGYRIDNNDDDQGGGDAPDPVNGFTPEAREALDRLAERDRVLVEARMLPTTRDLTPEEHADVRQRFAAYCAATGAKAARVAREVSYSSGVVSDWSAGKYRGDVDRVTRAVNDWMERDARRSQAARPSDYVKTWVAESIRLIVNQADKRCMMAAIVAPSGAGKTMVLKALADELRGVYLYCDRDLGTRGFLLALAGLLGVRGAKATIGTLKGGVVQALRGTRRIVLLDEAHQLGRSLGSVRSIHDQAGVPIVMAGTADILAQVNDRTDGRGQFSSRCIRFNLLDGVRDAERPDGGKGAGRDLFTPDEVRAFFAARKVRLAADAMRLMWALAWAMDGSEVREDFQRWAEADRLGQLVAGACPIGHPLREAFRGVTFYYDEDEGDGDELARPSRLAVDAALDAFYGLPEAEQRRVLNGWSPYRQRAGGELEGWKEPESGAAWHRYLRICLHEPHDPAAIVSPTAAVSHTLELGGGFGLAEILIREGATQAEVLAALSQASLHVLRVWPLLIDHRCRDNELRLAMRKGEAAIERPPEAPDVAELGGRVDVGGRSPAAA